VEEIGLEELRSYTGFIYVSLVGTLKQWQDYMAAPLAQPDVVHTLAIECDYRKTFRFRSKRFNLTLTSGLPKVETDSMLTLKFTYFNDGDNTVWDVGGLYLGDPERNGWAALRRLGPPATSPLSAR
jgi:hypothetical protein